MTEMKTRIGEVFVLLVCHDDGIVALSFAEIEHILDDTFAGTQWISASRTKRKMYTIKGSNGQLQFKIGRNDFPEKVLLTQERSD